MRPNQPVFVLRQVKGKKIVGIDGSMKNLYRELEDRGADDLPERKGLMEDLRNGKIAKIDFQDKKLEIERVDMMDFDLLNS